MAWRWPVKLREYRSVYMAVYTSRYIFLGFFGFFRYGGRIYGGVDRSSPVSCGVEWSEVKRY